MKIGFRDIGNFALLLLALVFTGYLLLAAVYALPTDVIAGNVHESYEIFQTEDVNEALIPGRDATRLDNHTNALMLLTAENKQNENIWKEAINCSSLWLDDAFPPDTLTLLHSGHEAEYMNESYARYWHGYLVYLKPLLMLFNYQQIRYILLFVQMSLVFAAVFLMGKKNKQGCILPFLAAVFFINPAVCSLSLQYTPVFVLTLLQFIVVLLFEDKYRENGKLWLYHFFVVGCLTVYFDLLTYPLVSFGIPVAFMISQYTENFKAGFKRLAGSGILWAAGYGLMWVSKWILGAAITGKDILNQAMTAAGLRTSLESFGEGFSRLDVLIENLHINRFSLIIALFLAAMAIVVLPKKQFRRSAHFAIMLIIALMPFAWYIVFSNHSWLHAWMTHRELAISVYALTAMGPMLFERNKNITQNRSA